MKYFARLDDREYECLIDESNGQLVVTVDGTAYRTDLRHIARSKVYSLLLDGRSYEFTLEEGSEGIECSGGAGLFHIEVEDARTHAARAKTAAARGVAGPRAIRAAMPGIVRELLVGVGDAVQPGQALLILEAMKMQNEIRADRAGLIAEVHIATGDTVEKGAKLIELE